MRFRGQGAFEYILLLAGVLLVVVLAIVILRGGVLATANNQIAGSLNAFMGVSDACQALSTLVIHPTGANATLTLCQAVSPNDTLVLVYSAPLQFNGSADSPGNMSFFYDAFGHTRIFLDVVAKNGTPLDMSETHCVDVNVGGSVVLQNLCGTVGETTAGPTPTPTPTPTPEPTPEAWPVFLHDVYHTGLAESAGPMTDNEVWNFSLGACNELVMPPTLSGGVVYVGNAADALFAVNETNGTQLWNYTDGQTIYSAPVVANGIVYFGSQDYTKGIVALNATNGSRIWNVSLPVAYSSPVVAGGVVYVGAQNDGFLGIYGTLLALNATTGSQLWNYTLPVDDAIYSTPAVANGVVYLTTPTNLLFALRASDGVQLWNHTIGAVASLISGSPAVVNGIVYAGSNNASNRKLYALNVTDGSEIWNFSVGLSVSSPAVANDTVYLGSTNGRLYAVNATNGSSIWNFTVPGDVVYASSAAVAGGVVYIGYDGNGGDGSLHALNTTTGVEIWSHTFSGYIVDSSPAVANGRAYVVAGGLGDCWLYAFG